ncbi:hypothetical protein HU200_049878 [Digitaria exilis]|uniref:Uncharacterized protein n=1 Tax=Digitaria exilis TaxID=1010633 RepID=A0A835ASH7_9POAL|nr:hypothetical protein HU200_049878 [Digitaria exilis]
MERQPGAVHHCRDPPQGHQPPEGRGHECDDDTDQQPPPPTPTPTPSPPPPPTPTTAPTSAPPLPDCSSYCNNQCYPPCQANQTAGFAQCWVQANATAYMCYDECSNNTCNQSPDPTACFNSLCSFNNCRACGNPYTSSCCTGCAQAPSSQYNSCVHYWDLFLGYCIMDCYANCQKNCHTQG